MYKYPDGWDWCCPVARQVDHDKNPFCCFKLMDHTTLSKIEDIHKLLSAFMSLPVPCAGIDGGGVVEELSRRSVTAVPAEINNVEPTLYYRQQNSPLLPGFPKLSTPPPPSCENFQFAIHQGGVYFSGITQ